MALPWGRAGPGSTEVGGVGAAPGSFLWGRAVARQSQSAAASTRPLWERFFSRVERRNRAALLPPACPPRGLFNSGGFQVVQAGTQKPCPVPFRMHLPSLGGSPVGASAPCVLLERGAVGLPAVGLPRGLSPRVWVPLESPTSSARTGSCGGVPHRGSFGKFHLESWASHLGVGHPLKPPQPLKRAL